MKTMLLLLPTLLINSCSKNEPHKPKEIHLYMCELSCLEYRTELKANNQCKFKEGKCYFQQGCDGAGYKKHKDVESAMWMSSFDCYLYKR